MLTSKQRAFLRAQANRREAVFQIGKGGVTPEIITQLYNLLEARELIKITLHKTAELTPRECLEQLAKQTGGEPVAAIGNKMILYKQSREHQTLFLD